MTDDDDINPVADALNAIALELRHLGNGNAVTNGVGAIEGLGMAITEAMSAQDPIDHSDAIKEGCADIKEGLDMAADTIAAALRDVAEGLVAIATAMSDKT